MTNHNRWTKFISDSRKRAGIALGIAVMSIGYNMMPIQLNNEALWFFGIIIFAVGIWLLVESTSTKSPSS